jgi:hypothetical protein
MHLPLNNANLNPTKVVCGDIKNRIASTNLKESQNVLQKSICWMHTIKTANTLLHHEKVTRGMDIDNKAA